MQPLDAAYERLTEVLPQIAQDLGSAVTEADTRLRAVDRVLIEVLGWPRSDIATADYVCKAESRSRLVVEAKRDGRVLGVDNRACTTYKLSGPVFKSEAAREGVLQAISYCGSKNAELAVVTNGREWIVLRGSRLGDGTDTRDGMAFVFPSLAAIDSKFSLFWRASQYLHTSSGLCFKRQRDSQSGRRYSAGP